MNNMIQKGKEISLTRFVLAVFTICGRKDTFIKQAAMIPTISNSATLIQTNTNTLMPNNVIAQVTSARGIPMVLKPFAR